MQESCIPLATCASKAMQYLSLLSSSADLAWQLTLLMCQLTEIFQDTCCKTCKARINAQEAAADLGKNIIKILHAISR